MIRNFLLLINLILITVTFFANDRDIDFIHGVDLSYLQEKEDTESNFYDENNQEINDLIEFFSYKGISCVRLRLFVNPEIKNNTFYCNLENTINMAKRINKAKMDFLLDIHFSDNFADPAKQEIPNEWIKQGLVLDVDNLSQKVSDYTAFVLQSFKDAEVFPKFIQVGNEITNGILFPIGIIKNTGTDKEKFQNLSILLTSAIKQIRVIYPQSKIILHIESSTNQMKAKWWFSCAKQTNIDYDIIGLSYYSLFHGTDLKMLASTVNTLGKTFNKPVFLVETSYPFTLKWSDNVNNLYGLENQLIKNFSATIQGQQAYYQSICKLMKKNSIGQSAVFWWEPDGIADKNKSCSAIENLSWFDFNHVYHGPIFR